MKASRNEKKMEKNKKSKFKIKSKYLVFQNFEKLERLSCVTSLWKTRVLVGKIKNSNWNDEHKTSLSKAFDPLNKNNNKNNLRGQSLRESIGKQSTSEKSIFLKNSFWKNCKIKTKKALNRSRKILIKDKIIV